MYAAEFICRLVETEGSECACAQIVRDDEGRLINDSLACDRRGTERVTIVGTQIAANLNERFTFWPKRPTVYSRHSRQRVAKTVMF
jgi:hypothetical protein